MNSLYLIAQTSRPQDREKAEALIETAQAVRQGFDTFQQDRQQSASLNFEHLIKPCLEALGFTGARCQLLPQIPNVYQLYSNGKPVAAITADPWYTKYENRDRLSQRAQSVWEATTHRQRAIFCNGFDWIMCSYEPDDQDLLTEPFSLDDPDGFWDLFFLSMERDQSPPQTPA